ncbi:siderophore-interacting protein [Cryobacterium sp. SO2]|uniref:siderophore-interacting protein n=1 Tax=Cryobacterium sp. SO2 TaxID=1897060 RepID=UPI00223CD0A1|nr:siderophore-interacting protein [Cryobacterium sp. SO2]WEO76165.1 siderophore-interacting protein [Cryobacterium sp. SO2]
MTARPFHSSANVLFDTVVRQVQRLSPGFLRITLTGAHLNQFAGHGLDQRVKILLPNGPYPAAFDHDLLPESEWRRRWRNTDAADRPALRSYTISTARPDHREVDLDFYVHARPGPASSWAETVQPGARLLVSGPSSRLSDQPYGIQFSPGTASRMLLAGDETAFPAIRGIASALGPSVRATIILEAGDPSDAAWLVADLPRHAVAVHRRGPDGSGSALMPAVAEWTRAVGADSAARGTDFYAWLATESAQVARLRDLLHGSGIDPARVHSQGYWNDRARAAEHRAEVRVG